jgi:hypothetical protein
MWIWLCECDYIYVDITVNIWMHCIWLYKSVFVDEMETQLREKPLRGSQTQEFHYSEDIARYKTVTLTCTDAVVVP